MDWAQYRSILFTSQSSVPVPFPYRYDFECNADDTCVYERIQLFVQKVPHFLLLARCWAASTGWLQRSSTVRLVGCRRWMKRWLTRHLEDPHSGHVSGMVSPRLTLNSYIFSLQTVYIDCRIYLQSVIQPTHLSRYELDETIDLVLIFHYRDGCDYFSVQMIFDRNSMSSSNDA